MQTGVQWVLGLEMKTITKSIGPRQTLSLLAIFYLFSLFTTPAADILLEKRGHVALSTDDGLDHQIL